MHLRHIRPRSVEWYDALAEEPIRAADRLSPEEMVKLRDLVASEQVSLRSGSRASPQHSHRRSPRAA